MNIVTATMRGDGKTNQDTAITTARASAVLDGATAWLPQELGRDGGWYSRALGALLMTRLDDEVPLADVLAEAINEMVTTYSLVPGSSPESTVTIARWDTDTLELLVLGDSPAVIYTRKQPPTVLLDDRLQSVGDAARKTYRDYLRQGHGYGPELRPLLAQLQRDEFTRQNEPGGYWIAAADPDAAHQAFTASYPLADVSAVLLLSDGAAAAVDEYGEPSTWPEALEAINRHGAAQFLTTIHRLEDTDSTGRRWPRAKCHDDKTFTLLQLV